MTEDEFNNALVSIYPELLKSARRLTRSEPDARDLLHEAVVKALANREKYQPSGSLHGWLYTIMRNLRRDIADHDARMATLTPQGLPYIGGVASNPEEAAYTAEVARRIAAVSEHWRATAWLVWFEDYTPAEAAERLGVCQITVRGRLYRLREQLLEAA